MRPRRSGTSHALRRTRERIKREGTPRTCAWCGELVDVTLPSEHPLSMELDHLAPRKYGGGDELSNMRVLHKRCNRQRGDGRRSPRTLEDRSASW